MTKRTILSLGKEILEKADFWAAELGVSRAEFIRNAVAVYAGELQRRKEEEEVLRQKEEAFKKTELLRKQYGQVGARGLDSTKIIRSLRDRDRFARIYERHAEIPLRVREKDRDR